MRTQTSIALACIVAFAPIGAAMAQAPTTAAATTSATASTTPAASAAPLTLLEAYRLALVQDAIIRTARAGADARRERIPQSRAQMLPNIAFQAGANRNNLIRTQPNILGVPTTTDQFYDSNSRTLILRQPLFRPALIADYRQARAQVADANASLEKEVQNLATRVTSAYLEALLA
ncbi:MAG: TolC family protein, partial [Ramlibacter sp.]|nr:TolC family protein [Ramlibacter sp.]